MKKQTQPLVILVDDREQLPLKFTCLTERVHLPVGDYSAKNCTQIAAIERKRVDELASCCGAGRVAFLDQVERLRSYAVRALVIEGSFSQIAGGHYESKINPLSIVGTLAKFACDWQIPIWFADDAAGAALLVQRILLRVHNQVTESAHPSGSLSPLGVWPQFSRLVGARLETGAREYAGQKPTLPETIDEILEELLDVCGWSVVAFARIQALRARAAELDSTSKPSATDDPNPLPTSGPFERL